MQKQSVLAALAALACTAALAQTPAGVGSRPPAEVNPVAAGGPAAAAAQEKVDTRTSQSNATPKDPVAGAGRSQPPAEINPTASGGKSAKKAQSRVDARLMDTNGDGMVSREEWDTYHNNLWTSMKPGNQGVSSADMDRMNRTPKTRH